MQSLQYIGVQQIQSGSIYRWMSRFCSQWFTPIALLFLLVGCSEEQESGVSTDSQLTISPPGVDRLSRMIDTATLDARILITAEGNTQAAAATPIASPEGSWTASALVPQTVPFSIEVIWSAVGVDDVRVDYAILREAYAGIDQNVSITISTDQYDLSASTFDSDNDGTSNFEELVAGTSPTGVVPVSAVAYYPLDNAQALDLSGNNHSGTVIGGVAAADESGTVNSAMRLGTSMERVDLPAAVVDGLQDFTVLFKVNFDAFNEGEFQYNTIFSVASQQSNELVFAYGNNETAFPIIRRFYLGATGASNIPSLILFEQMNTITLNSWHCVAVYRIGGVAGLVVDGEQIGDEVGFTTAVINADAGGFMIGQEQLGIGGVMQPGMAMAGVIDEFYVFDSALELQDIQNRCN